MKSAYSTKRDRLGSITVIVLFAMAMLAELQAQSLQRKKVTPKDYEKFYNLALGDLSEDGNWISYRLDYTTAGDTTIIQHTETDKKLVFPEGFSVKFPGTGWATVRQASDTHLINLKTETQERIPGAPEIKASLDGQYLIVYHSNAKRLEIRNLKNNTTSEWDGVEQVHFEESLNALVTVMTVQENQLALELRYLGTLNQVEPIALVQNQKLLELQISGEGKNLLFSFGPQGDQQNPGTLGTLGNYGLETKETVFMAKEIGEALKGNVLVRQWQHPLQASADGSRILFAYQRRPLLRDTVIPEVWKGSDPYIYPDMNALQEGQNLPLLGIWNPKKQLFTKLTDTSRTAAKVDAGLNQAILYQPSKYLPHPSGTPPIAVYLKNLITGTDILLRDSLQTHPRYIKFSPNGRYISYRSAATNWIYEVASAKHTELKVPIQTQRENGFNQKEGGIVGWFPNDQGFLINGLNDVWKVELPGYAIKRLTNGKETDRTYQYLKPEKGLEYRHIPENEKLWFFVQNDENYGISIEGAGNGLLPLFWEESLIRYPHYSDDRTTLAYVEETYTRPQHLKIWKSGTSKAKTLFQSNGHYKDHLPGRSERIPYTDSKGHQLSGILRYPIGYQKDSVYPLVVHIYEKQGHYAYRYPIPGWNNSDGFNEGNLVNKGYFVFLPDIEFEIGEPAFSAADCVISGTKAAMQAASIDPARIGLIGFSFGGHETMFTITQTDLFATSIAGAGVVDKPWNYLVIDNGVKSNIPQYEEMQHRMGKSLFEDYQGYLDNSPLYHINNLKTPLLIWSGKEDHHVDFNQSLAFHIALKRLGKPNTLLFYPGSGHGMRAYEHQKDLTLRIEQWFDHYLKGAPKLSWMP